jgi:hypothetical protein
VGPVANGSIRVSWWWVGWGRCVCLFRGICVVCRDNVTMYDIRCYSMVILFGIDSLDFYISVDV